MRDKIKLQVLLQCQFTKRVWQMFKLTHIIIPVSDISITIDPIKREDGQEIKVKLDISTPHHQQY